MRKKPSCLQVMAIVPISIAVLVLVSVAVGKIRALSVRSACISNVHKIGTALQMYAADWGGCAPPYTTSKIKKGEPPESVDFGRFASGPYLKRCLAPYGAAHIWHCPLDPCRSRWRWQTFPPIDHAVTSYYVDARVAMWNPVSIYKPPVIPVTEWNAKESHSMMPTHWADTDDVSQGGPYYLECCTPSHGPGMGRVVLKFDGSIVHPRDLRRGS